ncbi:MAG: UDP-3-O-(3-hydroxymyristoyl)glucosamine N-acyltransferase [Simkaniaceae bacterium]|nr:UDP-3-O-(3-hydroxymyristoyl)glucosamine N-acyltransferase [Simkaniaceae bacterium]MCF7852334.1 UDP-3-O-(3-hydroxymyristoyl)glucosamine N-acyltransferase [Simkaniaceae bacterium]
MIKHFTLEQLAQLTGTQLIGNPSQIIHGVDDIKQASETDATFLANLKYKDALKSTKAGVICVHEDFPVTDGKNYLLCKNPSQTFQSIAETLINIADGKTAFVGIHPTAVIDPSAKVESDVQIGPYAVIDKDVTIGKGTIIFPQVYIGPGVSIGENCILYPNVTVRERCILKNRVIIQPGAVIGSCGYGYLTSPEGKHIKLEQIGNVILEDDVEIGANTTIDRARFKSTTIGKGTKIDNLVQIGHNVQIGADNLIVAQTGIAGSSKTGHLVMMGGQVGIVGHVELADGVMIATRGGVSKSIQEKGAYGGSPIMPITEYNKQQVHLRKIEHYVNRIKNLENELKELKSSLILN